MLENAHALVVGIANYRNLTPLPVTVLNDAQGIYDTLAAPQLCAYDPANLTLLLDKEATHANLRQALGDLTTRCNPDSTVFFYISGHGGQVESGPNAGEYLLPVDVIPSRVNQTAISGTEFTEALRAIPGRKMLVVLDSCHSGGVGQPKDAGDTASPAPVFHAGLSENLYDRLKQGKGRAILASSRDSEQSWVLPGDANSLFTKHLLAGLRGGIPSEDGLIRLFDLFEYLQPKVSADQPNQHPIFKAEVEENFPVAFYQGGKKGVIAKDDQGFRYDVFINYAEKSDDDDAWVWETLVPQLEAAGLKVAVADDVNQAGVARVVNIERGVTLARRTMLVLSDDYFRDNMARFLETLAQTVGAEQAAWRVLPLRYREMDESQIPARLRMLDTLDLTNPRRAERRMASLLQQLADPLPRGY